MALRSAPHPERTRSSECVAGRTVSLLPQRHPDWRVVAGALLAADGFVDARVDKAARGEFVEQQEIDPEPRVARPALSLVVPIGVHAGVAMAGMHRIDPALIEEPAEERAGRRLQQRVLDPRAAAV